MKKNFVMYAAVVSFCLFFLGCKVSVSSSYTKDLNRVTGFSAKGGNGCVMLVWDLPEENTSEEVEYFVEYDGKTVPVDKSACCKKISDLKNGTEYTFSLYGQKMQSGKKGYVSTAKATPSEDGLDMAESVHQGYVVWFNLYERKDKKLVLQTIRMTEELSGLLILLLLMTRNATFPPMRTTIPKLKS